MFCCGTLNECVFLLMLQPQGGATEGADLYHPSLAPISTVGAQHSWDAGAPVDVQVGLAMTESIPHSSTLPRAFGAALLAGAAAQICTPQSGCCTCCRSYRLLLPSLGRAAQAQAAAYGYGGYQPAPPVRPTLMMPSLPSSSTAVRPFGADGAFSGFSQPQQVICKARFQAVHRAIQLQ